MQSGINNSALRDRVAELEQPTYVDSTGTPGAVTVAAATRCGLVTMTTTSVVVTHPSVTAKAVINVVQQSATAARRVSVVPSAGAFTIYISGYAASEPPISYDIVRF